MEAIKPFTIVLPYSLYERLDAFCKEGQYCKARIVRKAIERELKRGERKARKDALAK